MSKIKSSPISPLAPKKFPKLPPIAGVRFGVAATHSYYKGRDDLLFMAFPQGTKCAGLTTRSSMPSAAVEWCRAHLPQGQARALLVNAGNANAYTGKAGAKHAESLAKTAAHALPCPLEAVFMASTGVIGKSLNLPPLTRAISKLQPKLSTKADWQKAAQAIMTTDTFPKMATCKVKLGKAEVTLNGIAKGSGMVAPNMATMLAFFFTDAALPTSVLRILLRDALPNSFHAITIDGDSSTSDTILFFATGQTHHGAPIRGAKDARLRGFRKALHALMRDLAQQIVRDGEGISKFITVKITGAKSNLSARHIALSIANSPLVKTAIAGADANWGRVIMAIGKSGEPTNRERLKLRIGGISIVRRGAVLANYNERPVACHMQGRHILIEADIGLGKGCAEIWTSDLTHDYIRINADYRS
ncbi:MAG: bifunctional glutamate N-acetyltransferase/amino-acid acetyltransferase ArgJ [Alphaproteobacteria bacterium]|nr:bifunctional glutamate N-acetyltransferase/amino-acid acetyltransferase ArgJ [Alphaproteobacteria bacterium]